MIAAARNQIVRTASGISATSRFGRVVIVATLGLLPFLVSAEIHVDPALPGFAPSNALTGKISATGDDDMQSLMESWEALFKRAHPAVEVRLDVSSSALAGTALAAGAEMAFVGRKLLVDELAIVTRAWGYPPTLVVVAGGSYDDKDMTHAEMVWVNPANPIRGLTLAQLDAIFGEERKRGAPRAIDTWGDLGLTGDWADKPVHAFRHRSVGVTQFINEVVLKNGAWRKSVPVLDKAKEVPPTVARDKYSIGLAGIGFAKGLDVRAVPISPSADQSFVAPTLENVANRSYPLSRVIYIYVNKPPGATVTPLVREFLRAILSKDGQEAALHEGFLPLSSDWANAESAKLN